MVYSRAMGKMLTSITINLIFFNLITIFMPTIKSKKREIFDMLKKNGVIKKKAPYKKFKGIKKNLVETLAYLNDDIC